MADQPPHIRIALDAMGGDFAPASVVGGAFRALRESEGRFSVILVGQQARVREELAKPEHRTDLERSKGAYSVVHASEVVEMDDPPTAALKSKRDSSIAVGLKMQKQGSADAFVSAGNTGAVMSASTLILGRVKGVSRPTIGALIPTATKPCLLLDAGANIDSKARHLFEFGVMGSLYMETFLGRTRPAVALLSIGEEDTKGNEVTLEAHALFRKSSLNFVGNIEGRDLLKGEADVVICDGFVGNILLKFGESIPEFLKARLTSQPSRTLWSSLALLAARKSLRGVMKELDYQEHGGVPLLGVEGVSIIGHGRSTPKAIKNMVLRAEEMVRRQVGTLIHDAMARYG